MNKPKPFVPSPLDAQAGAAEPLQCQHFWEGEAQSAASSVPVKEGEEKAQARILLLAVSCCNQGLFKSSLRPDPGVPLCLPQRCGCADFGAAPGEGAAGAHTGLPAGSAAEAPRELGSCSRS